MNLVTVFTCLWKQGCLYFYSGNRDPRQLWVVICRQRQNIGNNVTYIFLMSLGQPQSECKAGNFQFTTHLYMLKGSYLEAFWLLVEILSNRCRVATFRDSSCDIERISKVNPNPKYKSFKRTLRRLKMALGGYTFGHLGGMDVTCQIWMFHMSTWGVMAQWYLFVTYSEIRFCIQFCTYHLTWGLRCIID